MNKTSDDARDDLLQRATKAGLTGRSAAADQEPELSALLRRYYRHTSVEDLSAKDPVDIAGAALSHRQLAQQRGKDEVRVRIFTPTVDSHGWQTGHTVVQVVVSDMPFLVDSMTAMLTAADRSLHLVIHPVMRVRRDDSGKLLDVVGEGAADRHLRADRTDGAAEADDGVLSESWMCFEIDRDLEDEAQHSLTESVHSVLRDVEASVRDWPQMTETAQSIAAGLPDATPEDVAEQAHQAQRLLNWLVDDHFTFLGYREYELVPMDGEDHLHAQPGGLGILRQDAEEDSASFDRLPPLVRARARDREVLVLTKANSRSTVHRPAYLDYVGIKTFDADGEVTGERRFLGLLSSSAYTQSIRSVPVADRKVDAVLERAGVSRTSHSGRDLLSFLETYPRDELLQTDVETIYTIATAVMQLQERRRTRVFLRRDPYGRFVSVLVYLPRDRYTTQVRLAMADILTGFFGAESVDFAARLSESVLARLHFVARMPLGETIPDVDEGELERKIAAVARTWEEDFRDAAVRERGETEAARLSKDWHVGEAYRADYPGRVAIGDLLRLEEARDSAGKSDRKDSDGSTAMAGMPMNLYQPVGGDPTGRRIKLYRAAPLSLTEVLPYFRNLGIEVIDERPYEFRSATGGSGYIYDFGLRMAHLEPAVAAARDGDITDPESHVRELVTDALAAAWAGRAESDGMDRLVVAAGLTWREVVILRTYARYFRQVFSLYSQEYVERTLLANQHITRRLVTLFTILFDPDHAEDQEPTQRRDHAAELARAVTEDLDAVDSLDADRILRWMLSLIVATVRTNYYQRDASGEPNAYVSIKLDPQHIPNMPKPVPAHEIWVYGPRVEGVHIRFGKVARGGLRWSDRPEDFRTEVLGLVKAQMVKNAVIVPTGAKGGFVAKELPDATDREAWMAEGVRSYQTFIRGLLDISDNLVPDSAAQGGRRAQPPPRVVRHDDDDTYLVVAADKGTATFSDIANDLSAEYGFWLGDAFASGGSAGYDHKEMGITARGAWESVKRHFRDMGHDTQADPFTVVGVGDMSGDVFGNGMLLSEQIKLVAAFDHRHIFVDPDPDPATSFAERRRLFGLGRSSWSDYDESLISEGGGVYPLSAKRIELTDEARAVLGLADETTQLTPAELKRAILLAPADLFWNGGIGTYIKASGETHADVGDKANDAIRVDGKDLRVEVIGEGGNLGVTQRGRIEAALKGVRVNSDAIDNSGGVDSSDHEVNIKILLNRVVEDGDLTGKQRNDLLEAMTDDVARMVLRNNYEQNVLLGNARRQSEGMINVHLRLMEMLEEVASLDRALEFLPTAEEVVSRPGGQGLTSPEFAVLMAYAKIALGNQILASDIPDDPWFDKVLKRYFPPQLVENYPTRIGEHPLRRQIVTTWLSNDMINRGGMSFAYRAYEETGADPASVARAYVIAREVFRLSDFVAAVEELDTDIDTQLQADLYLAMRRLIDRAARWLIQNRPLDVGAEIDRFAEPVGRWLGRFSELLVGAELERYQHIKDELAEGGVHGQLADRVAGLLSDFTLLDISEVSKELGRSLDETAQLYWAISDRFCIDELLTRVSNLDRNNQWEALARGALRDDMYAAHMGLTRAVMQFSGGSDGAQPQHGAQSRSGADAEGAAERIEAWQAANERAVSRVVATIESVTALPKSDLASMSVVLRLLRQLIRSSAGE